MKCVWCKRNNVEMSLDHIIPRAVGCPPGFVLKICKTCHPKLSNLDLALAESFDFLRFRFNIKGKDGKDPVITGRTNLYARYGKNGPEIHVNIGKEKVETFYKVLNPYQGKAIDVKANITELPGKMAYIKIEGNIGHHPKLSRALHKIALESVAYFLGVEAVLHEKYDQVRDFVLKGNGNRVIFLLAPSRWEYKNIVEAPYIDEEGNYCVFMKIAGIIAIVDLSSNQMHVPTIKNYLFNTYGKRGWLWLPV